MKMEVYFILKEINIFHFLMEAENIFQCAGVV
jgi:hypothetical protein